MSRRKLLFVCSVNRIRSLTAERIYEAAGNYDVRSAGTERGARIPITAGLLGWADLIICMEKKHRERLRERFADAIVGKQVICLHIPDEYELMEERLIEQLRERL